MATDILEKLRIGDLTGLNGMGLERLSNESKYRAHLQQVEKKRRKSGPGGAKNGPGNRGKKFRPLTGRDINNRDEQVLDMTEEVTSRGGKYIYTVSEPHTSAYKRRRVVDPETGDVVYRVLRPELYAALKCLKAGIAPNGKRVDFMIVPHIDRLTRDPRTLEDIIDVVIQCRRPIITTAGTLDLLTEEGQNRARDQVREKHQASADTARRVSRKAQALVREGIPGGGTRPYGWRKDKRRLHREESVILRKAVDDVFAGVTFHAICADWNRRGIRTVRGNRWSKEALKAVLRNPRMCGYRAVTVQDSDAPEGTRSRHMVIAYQGQGKKRKPIRGQWERMITPERWHALIAIIGDKPGRGSGLNTRSYLGTGTFRCGKDTCDCVQCDCVLRAQKSAPSSKKAPGHYSYTCRSKGSGGCGGIKIDGPKADAYLRELVFAKYRQQAQHHTEVAPPAWDGQAKLDRLMEDMAALRKARDKGIISADLYYQDLGQYEAHKRQLEQEQGKYLRRTQKAPALPDRLPEIWEELSLTEQRAIVERVLNAVTVAPAGRGRPRPVEERCTPAYTMAYTFELTA